LVSSGVVQNDSRDAESLAPTEVGPQAVQRPRVSLLVRSQSAVASEDLLPVRLGLFPSLLPGGAEAEEGTEKGVGARDLPEFALPPVSVEGGWRENDQASPEEQSRRILKREARRQRLIVGEKKAKKLRKLWREIGSKQRPTTPQRGWRGLRSRLLREPERRDSGIGVGRRLARDSDLEKDSDVAGVQKDSATQYNRTVSGRTWTTRSRSYST